MPTSFSLLDSHIVLTGVFSTVATTFKEFVGPHSQIDFIATGTALTMQYQANANNTLQVIVDGSASTPATTGDNTVRTLTVFTGLSDTAHRVTIKCIATTVYVATFTAAFSLTGAAPALALPSTTATGQFDLSGTGYVLSGQAGIEVNQGLTAVTFGGAAQYEALWSDACIRFRASPAGAWTIQGFTGQTGRRIRVVVNGVRQASVVQSSSNFWEYQTLASGTGDGTEKEFAVYFVDSDGSNVCYAHTLHLIGMTINTGYSWPARDTWAWYGDSILASAGVSNPDSTNGCGYQVCLAQSKADANRSIAGTTVNTSGSTRTADITGLSPAPKKCFVLYGSNDAATAVNTATFQTAFQTMMHALCLGLPSCHFDVLLIIPRSGVDASAYNTAISAAVAALSGGDQAQITIRDTSGWGLAPGGTDFATNYVDGVHPNAAGYTIMVNKLNAIVAGASSAGLPKRLGLRLALN